MGTSQVYLDVVLLLWVIDESQSFLATLVLNEFFQNLKFFYAT
jgi:hypothetical protein